MKGDFADLNVKQEQRGAAKFALYIILSREVPLLKSGLLNPFQVPPHCLYLLDGSVVFVNAEKGILGKNVVSIRP